MTLGPGERLSSQPLVEACVSLWGRLSWPRAGCLWPSVSREGNGVGGTLCVLPVRHGWQVGTGSHTRLDLSDQVLLVDIHHSLTVDVHSGSRAHESQRQTALPRGHPRGGAVGSQPQVTGHAALAYRTPLPVKSSRLTQCPAHLMRPFRASSRLQGPGLCSVPTRQQLPPPMAPQPLASSAGPLSCLFRPPHGVLTMGTCTHPRVPVQQ